jgi:hypothetical protein
VDLGDVALERAPEGLLLVRVRGGEEVRDVGLEWRPEGAREPGPRVFELASRGRGLLTGREAELPLPPGRWIVWASASSPATFRPLRSRARTVQLGAGREELALDLEETAPLVLLPGTRALRVTIAGPDPSPELAVPLELDGVPVRAHLLPGDYELTLHARDGTTRRERVTLPPQGATLQLD